MWRRIGRHSLIFAAGAFAAALLQIAFRLVAVHVLPLASYGRAALLLSVFNGLLWIGYCGVPMTLTRLAARYENPSLDFPLLGAGVKAVFVPTMLAATGTGVATVVVTDSLPLALFAGAGTPPMVLSLLGAGFLRGRGFVVPAASIVPAIALAQLVVLAAPNASGAGIGIGWVIASWVIGNVAGLVWSAVLVARYAQWPAERPLPRAPELRPLGILKYSVWLSVATLSVLALPIVARGALAGVSYEQVAYLDLALLIYSVPQRFTTSLVTALVPIASAAHARRVRVPIPGPTDALVLTGAVAALDAVLWRTHAVAHTLELAGLERYAAAENLVLIVLLAVPLDVLYGINAGLLAAFGRSRRLAFVASAVLVPFVAACPVAVNLGSAYVAGLLVLAYWALYLVSRRALERSEVDRRTVAAQLLGRRPFSRPRARQAVVPAETVPLRTEGR